MVSSILSYQSARRAVFEDGDPVADNPLLRELKISQQDARRSPITLPIALFEISRPHELDAGICGRRRPMGGLAGRARQT